MSRTFLRAEWRHLLMLNYRVDPALVARWVPRGTELDFHEGETYVSIVGFSFQKSNVFGVPAWGHREFEEVNLRIYVRRPTAEGVRRGVVFVREIVSKWAVATAANVFYAENYVCWPMRRRLELDEQNVRDSGVCNGGVCNGGVRDGGQMEYAWRHLGRWNRVGAKRAGPWHLPKQGSLGQFIVEHYWGYNGTPRGRSLEYAVRHAPWQVAAVSDVVCDFDAAATYGKPWSEVLGKTPASGLVADGSSVEVCTADRINDGGP